MFNYQSEVVCRGRVSVIIWAWSALKIVNIQNIIIKHQYIHPSYRIARFYIVSSVIKKRNIDYLLLICLFILILYYHSKRELFTYLGEHYNDLFPFVVQAGWSSAWLWPRGLGTGNRCLSNADELQLQDQKFQRLLRRRGDQTADRHTHRTHR